MEVIPRKNIKNLLGKYGIRPSKGLGQNFLVDKKVLGKIIEAASLEKEDTVLEIGPGIGTLTLELAKKVKKVVAVEKDPKMIEILGEMLKCSNVSNVEIVQSDALKIENGLMAKWLNGLDYKIVANLPYYITSPVIRNFLESKNPPSEMILMVQKEVAQRICARPPRMNLLAVSVQFYAEPKIISYVSKNSFWPSPKVDSAIIRIIPRKSALTIRVNPLLFFRIVKAGFSQPRKQILNNLSNKLALRSSTATHSKPSPRGLVLSPSNGLELKKEEVIDWLLKNNIQPTQRAETLNIQDWTNLTKSFHFK